MRSLALLLALAALAVAGCGGSDNNDKSTSTETQAASPPPADTQTDTTTEPATGGASDIKPSPTKDLAKKPQIPRQSGNPPAQLVKQDIVKGTGATAQPGDKVTMRYVGVRFRDNQEFDATWGKPPPNDKFEFPLGGGQVIQGWDQGIPGMRVGGRRQLTIPSDLAYGAQGSPPDILPNETLIFVVDLKKVQKG
jgi:FKBP-type peptidyl-prolyl cis-trans isomerase